MTADFGWNANQKKGKQQQQHIKKELVEYEEVFEIHYQQSVD